MDNPLAAVNLRNILHLQLCSESYTESAKAGLPQVLGPAFSSTDRKRVEVWLEPRLNIEGMPQLCSDTIEDMLKHLQRTGLCPAGKHCNQYMSPASAVVA